MRTTKSVYWMLVSLLVLAVSQGDFPNVLCSNAFAVTDDVQDVEDAELPLDAQEQLENILHNKEFHPRHPQQHWKLDFQGILAVTWDHLARWMRKHLEGIHLDVETPSFLKPVVDFLGDLGSLFLSFLTLLLQYWWVFLLSVTIFFGARWFFKRNSRKSRNFAEFVSEVRTPEPVMTWKELQELLQKNQCDQVVEELRKRFRLLCKHEYFIPLSATDREALSRIPQDGKDRDVFRRLVRVFERRVFASRSLEPEEVREIFLSSESFFNRPLPSRNS